MKTSIQGISSMATRGLLTGLCAAWAQHGGPVVHIESTGGVDAARRVAAGEPFDFVVLASDAIDKLVAAGRVAADGKADVVRSGVGVAVPAGAARPDIGTENAVRNVVLAAECIGYSTGPSGAALVALFKRWGIAGEIEARLLQAPPGVPVGTLLARGEATLGFQQLSELIGVEGIDLLGPLPPSIQILTTFSAGPCIGSSQPEAVRAFLDFLTSPETAEAKRRHGMEPVPTLHHNAP